MTKIIVRFCHLCLLSIRNICDFCLWWHGKARIIAQLCVFRVLHHEQFAPQSSFYNCLTLSDLILSLSVENGLFIYLGGIGSKQYQADPFFHLLPFHFRKSKSLNCIFYCFHAPLGFLCRFGKCSQILVLGQFLFGIWNLCSRVSNYT